MTAEIKSRELKIRKEADFWYLEGVSTSIILTVEEIESIAKFVKGYKGHDSNIDFQNEEQVLGEYISILNRVIQDGKFTATDFRNV